MLHNLRDIAAKARMAPSESAARAALNPLLTAEIYLVICEPERGERYIPETNWHSMTSRRAVLEHLKQHEDAVAVIWCAPDRLREDVSAEFARKWFSDLVGAGFDIEHDSLPPFIGAHLTDDELNRRESEAAQ